ncbi:hypothetical protein V2J09_022386 [Rumex salicifolius]
MTKLLCLLALFSRPSSLYLTRLMLMVIKLLHFSSSSSLVKALFGDGIKRYKGSRASKEASVYCPLESF